MQIKEKKKHDNISTENLGENKLQKHNSVEPLPQGHFVFKDKQLKQYF